VCFTEIPILQIKYAVKSTVVSLEHFIKFGDDVWNSSDGVLPWKDILSRELYVGLCGAVLV
jgi:hypothetical protein